jgi:IMP dehydrogenase
VRFADNPAQPVRELMTHENLATVRQGVSQEDARRLLHQRRIEKLLVVDDAYKCVGLITVKDIEKAVNYPAATKDGAGRLRVAGHPWATRAMNAPRRCWPPNATW